MIGKTVSHYRIIDRLGSGGMGIVYLALDVDLDRNVVLKFLQPWLAGNDEARNRLVREAQSVAALDHPNICTIHEIGVTEEGQVYLVMAYYYGQTLAEACQPSGLPTDRVLAYVSQVSSGLEYAHSKGVIHRDIKPGNLLLTRDDQVKILDFGLAKLVLESQATMPGTLMGTPAYMAPEQINGLATDGRTDIWALGVSVHELLTGSAPFGKAPPQSVFNAILNTEYASSPPSTQLVTGWQGAVTGCLQRNPDQRFQTISEFRDALPEMAKTSLQPSISQFGPRLSAKSTGLKNRINILLVMVVLLVLGMAGWKIIPRTRPADGLPAISVTGFTTPAAGPDEDEIHLMDLILIGLVQQSPVRVISSDLFESHLRKATDTAEQKPDPGLALATARSIGATLMLSGQPRQDHDGFYSTWKLLETDGGSVLNAGMVRAPTEFSLADSIVNNVLPFLASIAHTGPTPASPSVSAFSTTSPEAFELLTLSRQIKKNEDYPAAVKKLQAAVALDPHFALAYLELADAFWVQNQWARAEDALNKAEANRDRLDGKSLALLGIMRKQLEWRVPEALEDYRALLRKWPDDLFLLRRYTLTLWWWWYFEDAVTAADEALLQYPDDLDFHLTRLRGLLNSGRVTESLTQTRSMVALYPYSLPLKSHLAQCYLAIGEPDSAEMLIRSIHASDPESDLLTYSRDLAECAWRRGDTTEALAILDNAKRELPPDHTARHELDFGYGLNKADILAESGRISEAQALIKGVEKTMMKESDPGSTVLFLMIRAYFSFRWGDDRTILECSDAIADLKHYSRATIFAKWLRAEAMVGLRDIQEARRLLRELRGYPRKFGVFVGYAQEHLALRIALAEGDGKAAARAADRLPRFAPLSIQDQELRAAAYDANGDLQQAIATLEDLLHIFPGAVRDHLELGKLLEKSGRHQAARREYKAFLQAWTDAPPNDPRVSEAKELYGLLSP